MDYLVRTATNRDVAEIFRLEQESATAAHWTELQYKNLFIVDPAVPVRSILVAEQRHGTAILGFLVARQMSREWDLENIVVAEENRGQGIGTFLLAELVLRAQSTGSDTIFLEVRESNFAARALYAKFGFTETGRRRGYYSNPTEDAVLYSKTLKNRPISG